MKKIGELPAITDVPAGSLLIVNTENGTKKITYEDLCQAVKATLGIPTVVQSIDITEPGNIPDGPVIKAAFDSVNDLLLGAATYSAGKEIEMSWAELRAKIKTEDFSGLHIGDYKDIVLSTGEEARVDLSGFNTYMNVGDTAILTEPHLYFTFRDCLKTTYQMNSSNTNAGGTAAAALTATVNTTIYNTLPADLRAVMKEVRRLENNKGTWAWASRKLWLLQETEVFGRNNWSDGYDGGGIQLPIFAHSYRHIVKGLGKGAAERGSRTYWWLASPDASSTTTFCTVGSNGRASSYDASDSFGVAPGFIIS